MLTTVILAAGFSVLVTSAFKLNADLGLLTAIAVVALPLGYWEVQDVVQETKSFTVDRNTFPALMTAFLGPATGVVCIAAVMLNMCWIRSCPQLPSGLQIVSCTLIMALLLVTYGGYVYCLGNLLHAVSGFDEPMVWGIVCVGGAAVA